MQFHLAGHTNCGTHIIDTHNDHVIDAVWELYRRARRAHGRASRRCSSGTPTIPAFEVVHAEALKARPAGAGEGRCGPSELPLPRVQRWMQAVIVHPGTVDEALAAPGAAPRSSRPTSNA